MRPQRSQQEESAQKAQNLLTVSQNLESRNSALCSKTWASIRSSDRIECFFSTARVYQFVQEPPEPLRLLSGLRFFAVERDIDSAISSDLMCTSSTMVRSDDPSARLGVNVCIQNSIRLNVHTDVADISPSASYFKLLPLCGWGGSREVAAKTTGYSANCAHSTQEAGGLFVVCGPGESLTAHRYNS